MSNAQAAVRAAATLAAADIGNGSIVTVEQILTDAGRIKDWLDRQDATYSPQRPNWERAVPE